VGYWKKALDSDFGIWKTSNFGLLPWYIGENWNFYFFTPSLDVLAAEAFALSEDFK
jgi:hypothetical protein